jgi:hypothetical protein
MPAAASGATMQPVPDVRVTVPPSPFRPVSLPVSSKMICPGPVVDWTTAVDAPGVVAGVAEVKVMLPICELSPKVTVPLAVV